MGPISQPDYSWEMIVKGWADHSPCWVKFGKKVELIYEIPRLGIQWAYFPTFGILMG